MHLKNFFLTNFIFFIFFRIPKEIIYHLTPFYAQIGNFLSNLSFRTRAAHTPYLVTSVSPQGYSSHTCKATVHTPTRQPPTHPQSSP